MALRKPEHHAVYAWGQEMLCTRSQGHREHDAHQVVLGALSRSVSRLPLWIFEIPEQPVEGLLIRAMGLPAPKVANMPGVVNQRWPAGFLGHNRVVNPDRKEDGRALLAFPRQGGF